MAKGRATSGAAAGYYARALMQRHKYSEALDVLKDIINKKYGTYKLTADYGDNFREGSAYENNSESLFEVQFLDYGSQGVDDEWTPVNTSLTLHRVLPSSLTMHLATLVVGQISQLLHGSISSSSRRRQRLASLTHASTGPLVHTRMIGRTMQMVMFATTRS